MPHLNTKSITFVAAASVTQTLPENAVFIASIEVVAFAAAPAVPTAYTNSPAAAAGTVAQFLGTPAEPTTTVTFAGALLDTDEVTISYVPEGGLSSNL